MGVCVCVCVIEVCVCVCVCVWVCGRRVILQKDEDILYKNPNHNNNNGCGFVSQVSRASRVASMRDARGRIVRLEDVMFLLRKDQVPD